MNFLLNISSFMFVLFISLYLSIIKDNSFLNFFIFASSLLILYEYIFNNKFDNLFIPTKFFILIAFFVISLSLLIRIFIRGYFL